MDRDTIQELVSLSKLDLDKEQMRRAEEQIAHLLGHFEVLQGASTEDVEPSPYPLAIPIRPRPDVPEPALPQDAVLQNAPAQRAGAFLVPRVIEG